MMKIITTTLKDGTKIYGVQLSDGYEIGCLDEDAAYELAEALDKTTNENFDIGTTIECAA